MKQGWKDHKAACNRVVAAGECVDIIKQQLEEHKIDAATDKGIWYPLGVPSSPRFSLPTSEAVKDPADQIKLDLAIACTAPYNTPIQKKQQGNALFGEGRFEEAAQAYTDGIAAIFDIGKLCTKLPPPKEYPDDPNPDGWPQLHPNLDYWNSQFQVMRRPFTCRSSRTL